MVLPNQLIQTKRKNKAKNKILVPPSTSRVHYITNKGEAQAGTQAKLHDNKLSSNSTMVDQSSTNSRKSHKNNEFTVKNEHQEQ